MKKYRALGMISLLYKVLGIVTIIGGLVAAGYTVYLGTQVSADWGPLLLNAGGILVGSLISGIVLYAASQLLELLMDLAYNAGRIEYNTRGTAKLLQRIASRPAGSDGLGPRLRGRSVLEPDENADFPFLE